MLSWFVYWEVLKQGPWCTQDGLWSPGCCSAVYFPGKLEGCFVFVFVFEPGSHVAQAVLKLAFVADAGVELFLTLLLPLPKFCDYKLPCPPRSS